MSDAYSAITDQIIAALEGGVVPWHKPWNAATQTPRSLATNRVYRGINVFLLHYVAMAKGYDSPYWTTYKQAKARGGNVKKGERGTTVVFWKWIDKTDTETGEPKRIPFLRHFTVFNADQCENLADVPTIATIPDREHNPAEEAEYIVQGYLNNPEGGPSLGFGGSSAHYIPSRDHVQMPPPERFDTGDDYYQTLFHELTHSTAHPSRLNRDLSGTFGTGAYSREELVAELGGCFLVSAAGLDPNYDNSAAYIDHWLKRLREDKKLLVSAAGAAQKSADMILNVADEGEGEIERKAA